MQLCISHHLGITRNHVFLTSHHQPARRTLVIIVHNDLGYIGKVCIILVSNEDSVGVLLIVTASNNTDFVIHMDSLGSRIHTYTAAKR